MKRCDSHAFTLIECLVVIFLLVFLVALVIPAMGKVRIQASGTVCQGMQRSFGEWLMLYTSDYEDYLPGLNTSSVGLRKYRYCPGQEVIDYVQQPDVPVQVFDWMTPLAIYEFDLPANRAERFHYLMTKFRCPTNDTDAFLYGDAFDIGDFMDLNPLPSTSYLMPVSFMYWSDRVLLSESICAGDFGTVRSEEVPTNLGYWLGDDYRSRINDVGPASRKIFVADGNRYVAPSGIVDSDISLWPTYFGSWTSSGAWWGGSSEYGVARGSMNWDGDVVANGSPSNGRNLSYSYRHGRGEKGLGEMTPSSRRVAPVSAGRFDTIQEKEVSAISDPQTAQGNIGYINAVFYDGHVEAMRDIASREAEYWYPSGTTFNYSYSGMTTLPHGYVVP